MGKTERPAMAGPSAPAPMLCNAAGVHAARFAPAAAGMLLAADRGVGGTGIDRF